MFFPMGTDKDEMINTAIEQLHTNMKTMISADDWDRWDVDYLTDEKGYVANLEDPNWKVYLHPDVILDEPHRKITETLFLELIEMETVFLKVEFMRFLRHDRCRPSRCGKICQFCFHKNLRNVFSIYKSMVLYKN